MLISQARAEPIGDNNRNTAKQFFEEAISVNQQLARIIRNPSAPEWSPVIRSERTTYQDLLRRRGSLVLSPLSEWAVDLLLDSIKWRLRVLSDSTASPHGDCSGRLLQ